jgi:multicomponent Na+:H+ antiporter subunit E
MARPSAIAARAALFAAFWVLLAGHEPKALAFGAVVTAGVTGWSLALWPPAGTVSLPAALRHLPGFAAGSLRGGVDVARRACAPRLRLTPAWREVPTGLDGGARVLLGAELSVMPGTLAAGARDGRLLLHVLDDGAGFDASVPQTDAAIAAILLGRAAAR